MKNFFLRPPKTTWMGICILAVLGLLVLFLALFDWNWLRPLRAQEIAAKTGRPIAIDGDLKALRHSQRARTK